MVLCVLGLTPPFAAPTRADFPYLADPNRCDSSSLPLGCIPLANEMTGAAGSCNGEKWKYASTNFCSSDPIVNLSPNELFGVTGMSVDTAWRIETGRSDIVIAVHARSSEGGLAEVTEVELDQCWAANVRSIVMLAQRFAQVHEPSPADQPPIGRMVWFTSGQALSPMDGELAYAVSKGALQQMTGSVAHALVPARIVANCINPGPVDTGWMTTDQVAAAAAASPRGRAGRPSDTAALVAFLCSPDGEWINGQLLYSNGGLHS